MKLRTAAPLRADLAGGTIDIWPLYLLHRDASTVNVALGLRARTEYVSGGDRWDLRADDLGAHRSVRVGREEAVLRELPDGDPFGLVLSALVQHAPETGGEISTVVEGPPGGGIGGSSALLVALLGLTARLSGRRLAREGLADLARDLEARMLGLPTGVQDYHPAIHGGALHLRYGPGRARVEKLPVDLQALEERLVLAYSGKAHDSAPSNWNLYRRRLEGDPVAIDAFEAIARAAERAAAALRKGRWTDLGRAMSADWSARKELDPDLSPPDLEALEEAGRRAEVLASKGCGAASGGCMIFLLRRPSHRERLVRALDDVGARPIPFRIARRGLRVEKG